MFEAIPNWIVWRKERRAGKMTKIPYQVDGSPASSTDAETWTTYEKAQKAADSKDFSGVGFVLPLDSTILAVDIDHCLDEENNIISDTFKRFVKAANTYTEISQSGTGLHLFFLLDEPYKPLANRSAKCPGFELYSSGRYMTMMNKPATDVQEPRTVSIKEIETLLAIVEYPWKVVEQKPRAISVSLDDEDIKRRMFSAKNGKEVQALWEGDTSKYSGDDSAADFALCMHLAFWTQKDKDRMLSLWLSSPLGQRKKTQGRKDYQETTISHVIAMQQDVYSPHAADEVTKAIGLMADKKGTPFRNTENVCRILAHDDLLSVSFRHNAFSQTDETNIGGEWGPIQSHHVVFVTMHIQKTYPFFETIHKNLIEDAILSYAFTRLVNPPLDYIKSLDWDGEHRLDHWLHIVFGTKDDAYHSAVGANWMKGLVKRIVQPGCKFDYLLILEGPQGWRKSTTLSILGRGYHVESIMTPDNKDFLMLMQRNTIVEFSEGHTMNRTDTRLLKSIITMQEDQFRTPYGRSVTLFPRHCVFAMTTNQNTYLRDETGNRRFLPVELRKVADTDWLEANVDQMYAEAYHRIAVLKETVHEFPEEETKAMQFSKVVENPYQESLVVWYAGLSPERRDEGITARMAYEAVWCNNAPLGREMSIGQAMTVTSLFAADLKLAKKYTMVSGVRAMRWFPTSETEQIVTTYETTAPEIMRAFNSF